MFRYGLVIETYMFSSPSLVRKQLRTPRLLVAVLLFCNGSLFSCMVYWFDVSAPRQLEDPFYVFLLHRKLGIVVHQIFTTIYYNTLGLGHRLRNLLLVVAPFTFIH